MELVLELHLELLRLELLRLELFVELLRFYDWNY
jgi:hypothetical protein